MNNKINIIDKIENIYSLKKKYLKSANLKFWNKNKIIFNIILNNALLLVFYIPLNLLKWNHLLITQ